MNPCHFGPSRMSTASPSRAIEAPHVEVRLRRQAAPAGIGEANHKSWAPASGTGRREDSSVSRIRRGVRRITAPMENKLLLLLPPLQPPCCEFSMAVLSFQALLDLQLSLGEATH